MDLRSAVAGGVSGAIAAVGLLAAGQALSQVDRLERMDLVHLRAEQISVQRLELTDADGKLRGTLTVARDGKTTLLLTSGDSSKSQFSVVLDDRQVSLQLRPPGSQVIVLDGSERGSRIALSDKRMADDMASIRIEGAKGTLQLRDQATGRSREWKP